MFNARSLRVVSAAAFVACAVLVTTSPVSAVAPTPPTNLSAVVDGQNVALTWTASANNPTQYTVLAGFGPGQTIVSLPVNASMTSLGVTAPPGTYWVRVIASNADGASAPSNEVVVAVGCAPGTTRNFRVMQKGAEGFLFWNPVAGATGYALQAGFGPGRTDIQFNLPRNTFNVLIPAGVYHTRVVALNGCGPGTPSAEVPVNSPASTVRVPDPEPGTILSLPDVQDLVFRFAAQNPPTLANSCPLGRKYDPNPWLNALVDFLRTYDLRFGYNAKPTKTSVDNNGFPVIAAGDEIAYFRGAGTPMEGSNNVYAIDVLFNHCDVERNGQPEVTFRDIAPEPAIWTAAGRFTGDIREQ